MMRFTYRSRLVLGVAFSAALLPLLSASAATSNTGPSTQRPHNQSPLGADDIKVIQGVAQALLNVRQGDAPDPIQEALRKQVSDLGSELDQTLNTLLNTPPTLHLGERTGKVQKPIQSATITERSRAYRMATTLPDGRTLPAETIPAAPASPAANNASQLLPVATPIRSDRFAAVRARLQAIDKNQKSILATIRPDTAQGAFDNHLHKKTLALRDEVDSALASASAGDLVPVAKLRDRLKPKSLNQLLSERGTPATTADAVQPNALPSITTLTRHR